MRLKVLQAHIASMKEKADIRKREPSLQDDEVLKPITRCFTSIEVSTNRSDVSKYVFSLFCLVGVFITRGSFFHSVPYFRCYGRISSYLEPI